MYTGMYVCLPFCRFVFVYLAIRLSRCANPFLPLPPPPSFPDLPLTTLMGVSILPPYVDKPCSHLQQHSHGGGGPSVHGYSFVATFLGGLYLRAGGSSNLHVVRQLHQRDCQEFPGKEARRYNIIYRVFILQT